MEAKRGAVSSFVLGLFLLAAASPAPAQETVLERYAFEPGENAGGVRLELFDRQLGAGGSAKSRIRFSGSDGAATLNLRVSRRVAPGELVFALLVFKVEVRGYDASGATIYSRDLDGFTFGDAQSGKWTQTLTGIPAAVTRVEVIYYGNYE
jgi:hypothetical protein